MITKMHPFLHDLSYRWGQLRWYVKIIVVLVLLRIGNTIYRGVLESAEAKTKRREREQKWNQSWLGNARKIAILQETMREVEKTLAKESEVAETPPEREKESFAEMSDGAEPANTWRTSLAMLHYIWNRSLEGIHYLHQLFKQLLGAFLADFVAPKLHVWVDSMQRRV